MMDTRISFLVLLTLKFKVNLIQIQIILGLFLVSRSLDIMKFTITQISEYPRLFARDDEFLVLK